MMCPHGGQKKGCVPCGDTERQTTMKSSRKYGTAIMVEGCCETRLVKNQEQFTFTMRDSDSSSYEKTNNWPTNYVNDIMDEIKTWEFDFIFIYQTERVIDALDRRSIPYVIVEPDNMTYRADRSDRKEKRQLVKQQWFGRFALRDNSHIADFPGWLLIS